MLRGGAFQPSSNLRGIRPGSLRRWCTERKRRAGSRIAWAHAQLSIESPSKRKTNCRVGNWLEYDRARRARVVPAKDAVRRDDCRDLHREPPPDSLPLGCKPSALFTGHPEPPTAKPLLQDALLFDQVGEHLALLSVQPDRERCEEGLEWVEVGHAGHADTGRQPRNLSSRRQLRFGPVCAPYGLRTRSKSRTLEGSPSGASRPERGFRERRVTLARSSGLFP